MPDHPAEWRHALEVLAKSADGCTTSILLARGFPSTLVADLITMGLATAKSERTRAGQRTVDVTRIRITEAGRGATMTPPSPHPPRGLQHPRLGAAARQALVALTESPQGAMAAPLLFARGFKPKLVDRLVDAGLASKRTGRMKGGVSSIHVVLIKITDAGRAALSKV